MNKPKCDPNEVGLKSFFLGPQSENGDWLRIRWMKLLDEWLHWRRGLFPADGAAISRADQESETFQKSREKLERALAVISSKLELETPKFTPRYIGHMVSEISLPAMLGHVCALLHNPNNTSREVSRVTSRLEEEAIGDLATMLGFPAGACGHFTSGGTIANIEALWRAMIRLDRRLGLLLAMKEGGGDDFTSLFHLSDSRLEEWKDLFGLSEDEIRERGLLRLGPWEWGRQFQKLTGNSFQGPVILVPGNKHFSWEKGAALLGLGLDAFWQIELDEQGRMDISSLRKSIESAMAHQKPILAVISVGGTTEMGEVDPIAHVQDVLDEYKNRGLHILHHVDAAYGGYFSSMLRGSEVSKKLSPEVRDSLAGIARVDSVTLDPHKLGYIPYACGAFLTRSEVQYKNYEFKAPYLLESNSSRWGATIEGSRPGTGATATWLSNRVLGLDTNGYGRILQKGLEARDDMIENLKKEVPGILIAEPVDLNIICFSVAHAGERLSQINERMRRVFEKFEASPTFSLSRTVLSAHSYKRLVNRMARERDVLVDADQWVKLRLVLMNPFVDSRETTVQYIPEFIAELKSYLREA